MGAEGSCALGGRSGRSWHWAAALAEPQLLTYQGRALGISMAAEKPSLCHSHSMDLVELLKARITMAFHQLKGGHLPSAASTV